MRKKSIVRRLLPWVIVLGVLAALIIFVYIPIFTREGRSFSRPTEVYYYREGPGTLTMDSGDLLFEMNKETTQFKVTNKKTGKVWYSNPPDVENDEIAGKTIKQQLGATLMLTYWKGASESKINNFEKSILNQAFQVSQEQENGPIRVDYAIGNIDREYMIPEAITEARYKDYSKKVGKSNTNKFLANLYTQVRPKDLAKKSNKDELIARYPEIQNQTLYIMISDENKAKILKPQVESLLREAGYDENEYELDMQLVVGEKKIPSLVFNVSVIYELNGSDLVVRVPYSDIACTGDYPIAEIGILPFFGAAGIHDEGYIVVPEGGGSLIRFNNGKQRQDAYYSDLFGWDYYKKKEEIKNETETAMNVFGMSYDGEGGNGGAFLCLMEDANSYGRIRADVSGRLHQYNFIYPEYSVLHYDSINSMGRNPADLKMFEAKIPDGDIVQRYRFLDESGYMGMAKAYGEYLRNEKGMKEAEVSGDVPVNIELIGAIDKKVVRFGVLVEAYLPMTSFGEARDILAEMTSEGVRNLSMRYTGWMNGGVRQKVLTGVHTLNELGGDKAMKDLIADAEDKGADLYFDGISCFAYNSGVLEGFIAFEHAARSTTNETARRFPYDIVTFQQSDWQDPYYIVRPKYAKDYASNLIKALGERKAAGVAFRDIGNLLIADYNDRDIVTREQVKAMNMETMQEAHNAGLKVSVKEGNEYALPYADLITDMDLMGSSYAIIDENIPFYQIAIHGAKNYTGPAINLAADYQTALLECAAYGAGLNFTFMKADTKVLQDSYYSCYTSAGYEPWKAQVLQMIGRYQKEMQGLNNQKIVDFTNLTDQVSVTTYEKGTKVYVNYSELDYETDGITVPARDYYVDGGDAQ